MGLPVDIVKVIENVKGFLDPEEGLALYETALKAAQTAPCLEIGSYCGKSTVYLGQACKEAMQVLYAVDHHRGSEEHQLGEMYHDPELYDAADEMVDSFKAFRKTVAQADLDDTVIPIVTSSSIASRNWVAPLGMVFIDGGHSLEAAMVDYKSWAHHVAAGGILAIHDIFPDPAEGGQAPYTIWKLALESGLFERVSVVKTLGILRRINC